MPYEVIVAVANETVGILVPLWLGNGQDEHRVIDEHDRLGERCGHAEPAEREDVVGLSVLFMMRLSMMHDVYDVI